MHETQPAARSFDRAYCGRCGGSGWRYVQGGRVTRCECRKSLEQCCSGAALSHSAEKDLSSAVSNDLMDLAEDQIDPDNWLTWLEDRDCDCWLCWRDGRNAFAAMGPRSKRTRNENSLKPLTKRARSRCSAAAAEIDLKSKAAGERE